MAEHSELGLPWVIYDSADPLHQKIKGKHHRIGGMHVADVLGVEQAAYIVLAANNHHKLVEALEAVKLMLSYHANEGKPAVVKEVNVNQAWHAANNALAAVKEASNERS